LEPGERRVFELFDRGLPVEWEIYVQPHLNNLRPDFVLLHPHAGIAVFEVKDWDLSVCDWRLERHEGRLTLVGTNQSGRRFVKPNPFARLHEYRTEIAELFCPALNRHAGLASVTAGLIFASARDADVIERFGVAFEQFSPDHAGRRYFTLTGSEAIRDGRLGAIFPDHSRRSSRFMTPEVAADLRHWLVEPAFSAEQRELPTLSPDQRRYVMGRTESGLRRLRGPAGSGKTMVVAGRASVLADEGKNVLVVSYNITLLNYLRDYAARFGSKRNDITWLNFHTWCKRLLFLCGRGDVWRSLPWDEPSADESLGAALADALSAQPEIDVFDAILVDEGQDFHPSWWDALRGALAPGGEMLLVADRAQDLYKRNNLWTERVMEGAGFNGPWATLKTSYRMPRELTELTADYVKRFLADPEISPPIPPDQQELHVDPVDLRWIQADADSLAETAVKAIRTSLARRKGRTPAAFADVVFLCDQKKIGQSVVQALAGLGIDTSHTFAETPRLERQKKLYFFKGHACVKATTIHSFKGWEGCHVVVAVGGSGHPAHNTVYTAMTRLKRHSGGSHLTVVCASPELEMFGRTWPAFEEAA
jgi:hypothetical protein